MFNTYLLSISVSWQVIVGFQFTAKAEMQFPQLDGIADRN
jgi:hypothetical protein